MLVASSCIRGLSVAEVQCCPTRVVLGLDPSSVVWAPPESNCRSVNGAGQKWTGINRELEDLSLLGRPQCVQSS